MFDTHRRYMAGTNKLVTWLVDSAGTKASRKVRTNDLVPLAVRIVGKEPKVVIPVEILNITYDVIAGRKERAEWYCRVSPKDDTASALSNETHKYFIEKLEEVFKLLKTEYKKRLPKRKKKMPDFAQTADLSNLFSQLELEKDDVADAESTAASMPSRANLPRKTTSQSKNPEATVELDNGREEKSFAIWCLPKDLCDIRKHICEVFSQYMAGNLSFFIACRLAEASATMMRDLFKRSVQQYPDLDTFDSIIQFIGILDYLMEAHTASLNYHRIVRGLPPYEEVCTQERADVFCIAAYCGVKDFALNHDFGTVLMNICPAFVRLFSAEVQKEASSDGRGKLANADVFTVHLMGAMRGAPLPTGDLSVVQLYFDLYEVLKGDAERGAVESQAEMNNIQTILARGKEFISAASPFLPDKAEDVLSKFQAFASAPTENDPSACWTFCTDPTKDTTNTLPNNLVKNLPLLPGCLAGHFREFTLRLGLLFGNYALVVLAAAHLYRGAQAFGALELNWPDMDFVIEAQNKFGAFCRETAPSVRAVAKSFGMSLGSKLKQFTNGRRPNLPKLMACRDRGVKLRPASYFIEAHDEMLTRANPGASDDKQHAMKLDKYYNIIRKYAANNSGIQDATISKQWQDTKVLSGVQHLTVLQEIMVQEDAHLRFDYLAFTTRCLQLLETIIDSPIGEQLAKARHMRRASEQIFAHEWVNDMLWQAAFAETRESSKEDTALLKAGMTIRSVIEADGDECTRRAFDLKPAFTRRERAKAPKLDESLYTFQPWFNEDGTSRSLNPPGRAKKEEEIKEEGKRRFHELKSTGISESEAIARTIEELEGTMRLCDIWKDAGVTIEDGEPVITTAEWSDERSARWIQEHATEADLIRIMKGSAWVESQGATKAPPPSQRRKEELVH